MNLLSGRKALENLLKTDFYVYHGTSKANLKKFVLSGEADGILTTSQIPLLSH